MEQDNSLNRQLEEIVQRVVYIKELRSILMQKEPESDQALQLVMKRI